MTTTTPKTNIWLLALIGGIIGAVINSLIWLIAPSLIGQSLLVPNQNTNQIEALPIYAIIFASILPSFGAAGVLLLLKKFTNNGVSIFQILSAVLAVLSCIPALGMPITTEVKIVLSVMHLVAATAIVLALTRSQNV